MTNRLPCERMIWMRGIRRPCGQTFGVAIWIDATGVHHAACRHHVAELRHRYQMTESEQRLMDGNR